MEKEKFTDYGRSFFDVLAEALTFEKSFAPQVKKWESEFNQLDEKSERLGAELNEARVELDAVQASGFQDLREKRTAGKALSLAKDIHGRSVEILKLELEQARANRDKFIIASRPFQARRQQVRKFCMAMFSDGGISLKYQTSDYGMDSERTWIKKVEELERLLAVLDKNADLDGPVGYSSSGPEEILAAAAMLPASALGQLVEAWERATGVDAVRVVIQFNTDQVLRWKILKKPITHQSISLHDMIDYDISGEARDGRRRAKVAG